MKKIIIFLLLLIIGFCAYYFTKTDSSILPITANYICNEGKTIEAAFYNGEPKVGEPGEPPIPTGRVEIVLSDGRNFNLPQAISASGVRYANQDESFVFWSKGNGALVLENNIEKSYIGCVVLNQDSGGLPNVYHDGTVGFSVRYPDGYSIDDSYQYQAMGPGEEINGVKFTVPQSFTEGTNLSSFDTGVSVEIIPMIQDCNASLFISRESEAESVFDQGKEYSFVSSIEGAVGNRYEEYVWAIPYTNPCIAIRYFIHYGVIENYPEGMVIEFDRAVIIDQFDKIRQSLMTI
jgi:membrane-bound inhibitor of C-type lysozyme